MPHTIRNGMKALFEVLDDGKSMHGVLERSIETRREMANAFIADQCKALVAIEQYVSARSSMTEHGFISVLFGVMILSDQFPGICLEFGEMLKRLSQKAWIKVQLAELRDDEDAYCKKMQALLSTVLPTLRNDIEGSLSNVADECARNEARMGIMIGLALLHRAFQESEFC